MKVAKTITWIGFIAMSVALLNGFINGDFWADGSKLFANPWGIVSLVDLYVGFILFSMWIIFREKSRAAAVIWVILMMVFGFLTACIYTLIALYSSKGSWLVFFLGAQKENLISG
ncbi:MAG: DUF1475 family protein [Bacillota bacterium]